METLEALKHLNIEAVLEVPNFIDCTECVECSKQIFELFTETN